jgi:hypothetical protein
MSYAHGTSLSFANNTESATVLSDDKVLVTKCLNTDCQIEMPLSEWLELSRGKEQVEFIPVPLDSTNIESDEDTPKARSRTPLKKRSYGPVKTKKKASSHSSKLSSKQRRDLERSKQLKQLKTSSVSSSSASSSAHSTPSSTATPSDASAAGARLAATRATPTG